MRWKCGALLTAAFAKLSLSIGFATSSHPVLWKRSCLSEAVHHLRGGGSSDVNVFVSSQSTDAAWQLIPTKYLQVDNEADQHFLVRGCSIAGLSTDVDEKYLYRRADVTKLWNHLDNTNFGLWLDGGPGTGKSLAVWTWLCHQGMESGQNFMWIHLHTEYAFTAVECKHGTLRKYSGNEGSLKIVRLIETQDVDIVVLDGITAHDASSDYMVAKLFNQILPGKRIGIGITSMIDSRLKNYLSEHKTVQFIEIGPWSLEEFKQASTSTPFLLSAATAIGFTEDEINTLRNQNILTAQQMINWRIENKFYYAGGSARWMFQNPLRRVLAMIHDYRDELANINSVLDFPGIRNVQTFNPLLTRIPRSERGRAWYFYASQYVTHYIVRESNFAALNSAYEVCARHKICDKNPSYLGWVACIDFVAQLERASMASGREIMLLDLNKQRIALPVPAVVVFAWESLASHSQQIFESCWMRPAAWNEAGFDLIRLHKARVQMSLKGRYVLQCFQVTRGSLIHKVDLLHFSRAFGLFQEALGIKIEGISITFITPYTNGRPSVTSPVPQAEVANQGLLSSLFVGSSKKKWVSGQEKYHINVLGFQASCDHALTVLRS